MTWSLVEASERSGTFYIGGLLFIAWMFSWLLMLGLVVFLLGYGGLSLVRRDFSRAANIVAGLVVLALALVVLILAARAELPLRVRFEVSEGALNQVAEDHRTTGTNVGFFGDWAGLYHVESVYTWENCVVLITGTFFLDESGFTRCDGDPPAQPPNWIEIEHLTGDWWTFYHRD